MTDSIDPTVVLACVDFSDVTRRVVEAAAAQVRQAQGELVLLHVAPDEPDFAGFEVGPQTVRDTVAHRLREEHRQIQELADEAGKQGVSAEGLMVTGMVTDKVMEQAEKLDASLLVVGSHGHGALHDLLVGSVTESILRRTTRPVLVVPARGE